MHRPDRSGRRGDEGAGRRREARVDGGGPGGPLVPTDLPRRAWWRRLVVAVLAVVALYLQREHLGELPAALSFVAASDPGWLLLAAGASATTYLMAAIAMVGTVHEPLRFTEVLRVQVASGLTTLAGPAGLGSAGLNVWFLERRGVHRQEAIAAAVRNGLAGGIVHVAALLAVLSQLPKLVTVDPVMVHDVLDGAGPIAAAGVAALTLLGWGKRRSMAVLLHRVRASLAVTRTLMARPGRAIPLVAGSVGLLLAYGLALWASAGALGVRLDVHTAIALEVVVATLGAVSVTPGGAGVVEAAALQGLLFLGVDPAAGLGVVLVHRLMTFWLPALPGAMALRRLQHDVGAITEPRHPRCGGRLGR